MDNIKFRVSNCILQYSSDNGQSWNNVENWTENTWKCFQSQEIVPPYTPEELGGQDSRCIATENVIKFLQDLVASIASVLAVGGGIIAIGGVIISVIGLVLSGLTAAPVLIAVSGSIVAFSKDSFEAIFTSEVWNKLRIILYCHANNGGQWDNVAVESIKDAINNNYTGAAQSIIFAFISLMSSAGLTNSGRASGILTADCSNYTCPSLQLLPYDNTFNNPAYNISNDLYTVSQLVPNSGSDYIVKYRLPYLIDCARIQVFASNGTSAPPNLIYYTGIRDCNSSGNNFIETIGELTQTLNNKCFNAFYIRTTVPIDLKVRISPCTEEPTWCYRIDLAQSNGGFTGQGQWQTGGWKPADVQDNAYRRQLSIGKSGLEAFTLISINARYDYYKGNTDLSGTDAIRWTVNGQTVLSASFAQMPSIITDGDYTFTTETPDVTQLNFTMQTHRHSTDSNYSGDATLKWVEIQGKGTIPQWIQQNGIECAPSPKTVYYAVNDTVTLPPGCTVTVEGINGTVPVTGNYDYGYGTYADCTPGQSVRVIFEFDTLIEIQSGSFFYSMVTINSNPGCHNFQRIKAYNGSNETVIYTRDDITQDWSFSWYTASFDTVVGVYDKIVIENGVLPSSQRNGKMGIRFQCDYFVSGD